jgi:adenosylcobyric acid synthase
VCGGFQMLGQRVSDPHGVEASAGDSKGLGLLELSTTMGLDKHLRQVAGVCIFDGSGARVEGYEIHMGASEGAALACPAFRIGDRNEGACSADGQVMGTYLHGLFDDPDACSALLRWAGLRSERRVDAAALREASLDRIADAARPLFERLLGLAPS